MKARWIGMGTQAVLLTATDQALAGAGNVEELYRENCASCHGSELNEGLGGSLVDGIWKHGEADIGHREGDFQRECRCGHAGFSGDAVAGGD